MRILGMKVWLSRAVACLTSKVALEDSAKIAKKPSGIPAIRSGGGILEPMAA